MIMTQWALLLSKNLKEEKSVRIMITCTTFLVNLVNEPAQCLFIFCDAGEQQLPGGDKCPDKREVCPMSGWCRGEANGNRTGRVWKGCTNGENNDGMGGFAHPSRSLPGSSWRLIRIHGAYSCFSAKGRKSGRLGKWIQVLESDVNTYVPGCSG